MKFIINPVYQKYESALKDIVIHFEESGELVYEGRNLIKKFNCEGNLFTVKRFRIPHIINRIAYITFRSSKAKRSYINGVELIHLGFQTPMPVAYVETYKWGLGYSYYITIHIEQAHEMREFWFKPEIGNRMAVLHAFGKFTAELHKHNILHKDYSAGNILYKMENGGPVFYLVDINRMRFNKKISYDEGCRNFERLWLPDQTYRVIAKSYANQMGYNDKETIDKILYYKNKFMKE